MGARRVLPYGSWPSAVSLELVLASSHGLSGTWLDGEDLYFLESRPEEAGRIVLMRRDAGGRVGDVTPAALNVRTRVHEYGGGAFTVDRGTVVFSHFGDDRLYVQAGPGAPAEPLTAPAPRRYADLVVDHRRDRILAVVEDHAPGLQEPRNLIGAVSLADGRVRELVTGHDFVSDPRLDPSGTLLAWLAWERPDMPWDASGLWVAELDVDGRPTAPRLVAGGPDESTAGPTWAPDGSLLFASDRSGWWNVYRWRPGRDDLEPVAPMEAECAEPAWVLGLSTFAADVDGSVLVIARADGRSRLLRVAPDGSRSELPAGASTLSHLRVRDGICSFVASPPASPAAVVRLDLATGAREEVRAAASLDLDPAWISVPRHVSFPTSGGRTAHAFFYPPANPLVEAPDGERPPLIVMSHGGPTADADDALSLGIQAWTSRGLAVVDVDYGGSSGYGRAYRGQLRGAWGIVDVDDCTNAAMWLAQQGWVDGSRLAIRGGSAGGFTTLAALCFRETFACGVSLFGVADLEALARDTHKFESRYLDGLVAPWPEGVAVYRARSPIHHVDRIRRPVLVLQGADDMVVPMAQAEAIVEALARNGIPHAYLLFEGEGHGFRRAASQRRAREAELSFYAQVFGFDLADSVEPVEVTGLDAWRAAQGPG